MRTPAKKTVNLYYEDRFSAVMDLIASSIAPLFYACSSEKKRRWLKDFIDNQTSPGEKSLIKNYLEIFKEFRTLLNNMHEILIKQLSSYKSELTQIQDETKNKIEIHQQACDKYKLLIEDLNKGEIQKFGSEDWSVINTIFDLEKQIRELQKEQRNLEFEINTLKRQFNPLQPNETAFFMEEIMLFCINPTNGVENLEVYLGCRVDITNFFFEHQKVFNEVAEAWIMYVLKMQFPIKNHPLPMYLCPYNADDEQFNTTIEDRIVNPFDTHLQEAISQGMPLLERLMDFIQYTYETQTDSDSPFESKENCSPTGRSTNANRMFNSMIKKTQPSDKNPSAGFAASNT